MQDGIGAQAKLLQSNLGFIRLPLIRLPPVPLLIFRFGSGHTGLGEIPFCKKIPGHPTRRTRGPPAKSAPPPPPFRSVR